MEQIYLIILSVLFSCLLGIVGFWIKTVHAEIKTIVKELTTYTVELRTIIVGIQMQIQKGIETDITDLKENIKTLYERTNDNRSEISSLKGKDTKNGR